VVDLAGGESGYLVLSEAFFPGWRAYVDGVEAPVLRANYVFRAVPLPEGARQVTFSYQPASWRLGLAASALGWVLVLAMSAWWFRGLLAGRARPKRLAATSS
jgi:uncharacterized membrane protein YfhO